MAVTATDYSLPISGMIYPHTYTIGTLGASSVPITISWSASTWIAEAHGGQGYKEVYIDLIGATSHRIATIGWTVIKHTGQTSGNVWYENQTHTAPGGTVTFNAPLSWAGHAMAIKFSHNDSINVNSIHSNASGFTISGKIGTIRNVTINSTTGGTATATPTSCLSGTTVNLRATANSGYHFVSWTTNVSGITPSGATTSFTMPDSNITVTANFEPDVRTLTITQQTGGTLNVSVAGQPVSSGATIKPGITVTLAYTQQEGYIFGGYVLRYNNTDYKQTTNTFAMPSYDTIVFAVFNVNADPPEFTTVASPIYADGTNATTYIQNVTKVRATIEGAVASPPKVIDSYNIAVAGHGSASAATYTSPLLTSSGNIRITYTVTDDNGNYTTQTQTITVNAYQNPGVSIQFERCDSNGNATPVGTYFRYKGTGSYTNVDYNYITGAKIIITSPGQYMNTEYPLTLDNAWHIISGYTQLTTVSVNASVVIADKWSSSTIAIVLANANFAIYLNNDGTSIGFGRATSHTNSIEFAYDKTIYIGKDSDPAHDYTLKTYIQAVVNGQI